MIRGQAGFSISSAYHSDDIDGAFVRRYLAYHTGTVGQAQSLRHLEPGSWEFYPKTPGDHVRPVFRLPLVLAHLQLTSAASCATEILCPSITLKSTPSKLFTVFIFDLLQ